MTTVSGVAGRGQVNTEQTNLDTLKQAVKGSGSKLQGAENNLVAAFKSGDQDLIGQRQIEYQREQRIFELLNTFIKNLHEMLMSVIRLLRLQ